MSATRDSRSESQKAAARLASNAVRKLRQASDNGETVTPSLIGKVQDDVADMVTSMWTHNVTEDKPFPTVEECVAEDMLHFDD